MKFKLNPTAYALAIAMSSASMAVHADPQQDIKNLQAQVNELASQIEEQSKQASSSKTTIGGYGELHYNNLRTTEDGQADSDKKEFDFHRFVLFVGHDFSDSIRFFSEFEIEHALAGEGKNGEVEVEQAYIEMDLNPNLKTRFGVTLVPVGILNETHEPPTFYGVERNPVEKRIIPATWWSGGVSLHGTSDSGISYDLVISEGLNLDDSGAMNKIRSGRQKTSNADATSLAYTGRIKYTGMQGLELAATARYESDLSQGNSALDVGSGLLLETHAVYQSGPFTFKGLYAQWDIEGDDAEASDQDKQSGYYLEPSYKFNDKFGVFARYNQWQIKTGSENKETQIDVGLNYLPHPNVVLKADIMSYEKNNSTDKKTSGFNLGVGYQF